MDYNKIGELIISERKAKKLTQAKLSEKLFVSEKTISKWETGKGIPDANSLQKLSEIFDISINELLNGERITTDSYSEKAEQQLLKLRQEKQDSDRRLLVTEIILAIISTISFIIILLGAVYAIETLHIYTLPIIAIILDVIMYITAMSFGLFIEQKAGYYLCPKCNHKYIPTYTQVYLAMHINRTRFMKCPHCKKISWNKKIIK